MSRYKLFRIFLLLSFCDTASTFIDNLNRDWCNLKQWLQGNKLSLNLIKTQAMVVGSRRNLKKISEKKVQPPTFVIDDSQIEIVEKAKYLGVQLDQHLVWDDHARYVCTKVSRALGFLKYAKKLLSQETLNHIYKGIVEPYFRYCSSVGELWGNQTSYSAEVTKSCCQNSDKQ